MEAKVNGKVLELAVPMLDEPQVSKAGKSILLVNCNGNNAIKMVHNGKQCTVTVTMYYSAK